MSMFGPGGGLDLGFICDVKRTFFDRKYVKYRLDAATLKALGRIGSYVRSAAQNSIKTYKATKEPKWKTDPDTGRHYIVGYASLPGKPPISHTGLLKRGILFGYDKAQVSVVIGPTLLGSGNSGNRTDALEMLEYGGVTFRKKRPARYRARPFMGPAMENSAPFDRFWKDSVK